MKTVPLEHQQLTEVILAAAIEVHRTLGPGLLESAYEQCLAFEMCERGLAVERQVPIPLKYKGITMECGYRADMIVSGLVLIEVKAVEKVLPIHEAQLLSYLRITGLDVGFILNFHVRVMTEGIVRRANNQPSLRVFRVLRGEEGFP